MISSPSKGTLAVLFCQRDKPMSKTNGQTRGIRKRFKVAAVSSNTNAFGLNRFLFVARDGETWAGHKAKQYARVKHGNVVELEAPFGRALTELGFEIPERVSPDCPPVVVQEIWGKA